MLFIKLFGCNLFLTNKMCSIFFLALFVCFLAFQTKYCFANEGENGEEINNLRGHSKKFVCFKK